MLGPEFRVTDYRLETIFSRRETHSKRKWYAILFILTQLAAVLHNLSELLPSSQTVFFHVVFSGAKI